MREKFGTRILILAMLLASASRGWAALGQPVASVENDRAMMRGELKVIPGPGFSVHQITTPERIVIREYVSTGGIVFGVSWRGPVFPDLSQLLGAYSTQFQKAAGSQPSFHRRHIFVHTPELSAETGGHMRDLRGRAYVPTLLPVGVSAASIQ